MTAPKAPKSTPILEFLLEGQTAIESRQYALSERLDQLAFTLQTLHSVITTIEGRTSVDAIKLEGLRATAMASLVKLEQLGEGSTVEVKHVVRDGDGNIISVITSKPPTGVTR